MPIIITVNGHMVHSGDIVTANHNGVPSLIFLALLCNLQS